MKICLIYPGITESGFNSRKGSEGTWMHHGLAILSSVIQDSGYKVDLIDLRQLKSWDHFQERIISSNSQVFGITMMSVDYNPATKAARIIKKIKSDSKIIVGGAHPTICPDELINMPFIDTIVQGEGEIVFPQLLNDMMNGLTLPRIVQGERINELDQIPFADRELFGTLEEPFVPFLPAPFVTLIAGRGCRYNCNFCQPAERIIFGNRVRRRSVRNIIEELKYLRTKYQFKSFMIHDDCLTEDRNWIYEFCNELKQNNFNHPFVCQSRADIICKNPDMVKSLRDVGLKLMIIGFESGSDRILKFLRKGSTRAQNIEAANICHDLGIKIWANYMLGLPTETQEEVMDTFSMIEQLKPYHCSPAFYTPHPGSDLYEIGKKMGVHKIVNHDSFRRNVLDEKIEGPDYSFLRKIFYRSFSLAEDMNTPTPVFYRHGIKKHWYRWRNVLRGKIMRHFPGFYYWLKQIVARISPVHTV